MVSKINKSAFIILFIILVITFFARNNYRNVDNINAESLKEPVQTEVANNAKIEFTKDEYEYILTPLFDYEISGIVVSKKDYTLFSIYKKDSVFPLDLCIIWGDNVESKVFQKKSLTFGQDMRFCFVRWSEPLSFSTTQFSNSHFVIESDALENKMQKISVGDQIKVKGKLVNIKAKNIGNPGEFDPEVFNWNTSTVRDDDGAGACETIFVEDFEILEKANVFQHSLFRFSLNGLILLIVINIFMFFFNVYKTKNSVEEEENIIFPDEF
ncbi:MAG: hypothetical protein E3J54_02070 [Actinobacteria bacterium]|nr:MAG: hypothetical protein E3J54_02070 [Actinomycetota bacterium]